MRLLDSAPRRRVSRSQNAVELGSWTKLFAFFSAAIICKYTNIRKLIIYESAQAAPQQSERELRSKKYGFCGFAVGKDLVLGSRTEHAYGVRPEES